MKHRTYGDGVCTICGSRIVLKGNLHPVCDSCLVIIRSPKCRDCGCDISNSRRNRCNSCAAKYRFSLGVYAGKGHKNHEYAGHFYRSGWEVDFACFLNSICVSFEYERYDKSTNTYPDFYLLELGMYIEIHPVHPEKKIIPTNCVLLTSKKEISHMKSIIEVSYSDFLSWESLDLCMYLKQALIERGETK